MKKQIFTIIVFCFSYCAVYGQITTEEDPISFRRSVPTLTRNGNTQKIEELTLYIIEQEKQMKELQKQVKELQNENKKGGE